MKCYGVTTQMKPSCGSSQFYESAYCFSGYRAASPFGSDFRILKTDQNFENSSRALTVFGYLPKNRPQELYKKMQC